MNYDACERERGIETVLGGRYDGTRRREEGEPARGQKPSATMIRRRRRRLRPVPYTGSGLVGGKKLWSLLNEPAAYPTAERRKRGIRQRERERNREREREDNDEPLPTDRQPGRMNFTSRSTTTPPSPPPSSSSLRILIIFYRDERTKR